MTELARKAQPQHPLGWRCDGCKKWLAEQREAVCVTGRGPMKVADALRQAIPITPGTTVDIAPCTAVTQWVGSTADNWCWNYLARLEQ